MKYAKVKKQDAEAIIKEISLSGNYAKGYPIFAEGGFVFFPLNDSKSMKLASGLKFTIVDKTAKIIEKPTMETLLKGKLPKGEIPAGFDSIGTIAILELTEKTISKCKLIAEAILKLHPNIKTVVSKASEHKGEFRLQSYRHLAGEKTTETIHKENGVALKLDIAKVYFSPRSGTERNRVASQVKPGEHVLVMFSGCGPYVCVIAKNVKSSKVVGVELNPDGHQYAVINKNMNRLENVELFEGDVAKVLPMLKFKFDRIVMPLPKTGADFLDIALKSAKKGAIIHFYDFQKGENFPKATLEKIRKSRKKFKVLSAVLCGSYSPGVSRVCLDFQVGP